MNQRLKTFLIGFGSVMSVYPATNYASFVPKETPEERMRGHWEQTGAQLRAAMNNERQEQDDQKKAD